MEIKLGGVPFKVRSVKEKLRAAVLADPIMEQAVWRDVYRWDHAAGSGEILGRVAENGAVPMPNGMVFYVPRSGSMEKNDAATRTMSKKVLEAVGAKGITDVLVALHKILHMPQKVLPLELWEPLNKAASYRVSMHTEYAVLELRNQQKKLAFMLGVPGQVAFHHEVTAKDDAAYDALELDSSKMQPAFLIPAHSRPNQEIRKVAVAQRIKEIEKRLSGQAAAGDTAAAADTQAFRMAVGEWRLLTKQRAA